MEPNNSWTLSSLLRAFIDLAVTYLLLCGSAYAFVVSKFLSICNLFLPCPCKGILGYQNDNICWHRLVDFPMRKIQRVKMLIWSRFPFDYVMLQFCRILRSIREFKESEEEGAICSCSRFSGAKLSRKKLKNQKDRTTFRRRKRATGCSRVRYASEESLGSESLRDHGFYGELNYADSIDMTAKGCSLIASESFGDNEDMAVGPLVEEIHITNSEVKLTRGNEANLIEMLKEALEKEKAACAALYLELEEERAAAATAADQAMDMISRLQEERSSLEMEARQYQRMTEARIACEEEEMEILKEILISRDLEIHSLEKEVESYRRPCSFDDQVEGDLGDRVGYQSSKSPSQIDLTEKKIITTGGVVKTENWSPNDESTLDARQGEIYSDDGDWLENVKQHKDLNSNEHTFKVDKESTVFDVHVVNENTGSEKQTPRKYCWRFPHAGSDEASDCP